MIAHNTAVKLAQNVQELLLRQKNPAPDIVEAIDIMDSLFNILHGLREEEKEIARFEGSFRETGLEEIDDIDADEEAERIQAYTARRDEGLQEYDRNYKWPDVIKDT